MIRLLRRRHERLAGIALTALAAASAAAAADPAQPPDIVVTGSGLQQPLGSAAYDIVTIDRTQLTTTASGRIESALLAAGIARFRRADATSAHPTSQGVTMRGLGGNAASRGLILLDGVPVADPFGSQISYPALDPSRLGLISSSPVAAAAASMVLARLPARSSSKARRRSSSSPAGPACSTGAATASISMAASPGISAGPLPRSVAPSSAATASSRRSRLIAGRSTSGRPINNGASRGEPSRRSARRPKRS